MKFKFPNPNFTCLADRRAFYFLLFTLVIGAFFRFYNLNWDQGYFFNPDETNNISLPASHLSPPFKPEEFTYGSLTIYLYRALGELVVFITNNSAWIDAGHLNLLGRFVSATLSTLMIFVVYLLGKKIADAKTGLLAAFLTSVNVGLIQAAHFGTTETILTLGGILLIFPLLTIMKKEGYSQGYWLWGLTLGIVASAKISALVFTPIFLLAHLISLSKKEFVKRKLLFLSSGLLLVSTFFLISPYTFIAFPDFFESFKFESGVASGKIPIFYTAQFLDTTTYFFQIKHIFPWIAGWPVMVFSFFGLLLTLFLGFKTFDKVKIFLVLLPLLYFLYTGSLFVKWTRYMVPLMPFLSLFASVSLVYLFQIFKKPIFKSVATVLICVICVLQALWAIAFFNIYQQPDTRIMASKWIYQNIPNNSKILLEPLDVVSLPLSLKNYQSKDYQQIWFDFYGLDDYTAWEKKEELVQELSKNLETADFIIIGSRRLWANRIRLDDKFPLGSRYYKSLFAGNLGYEKIKEVVSTPKIGDLIINDNPAEETFQVFDHPTVIIFKNTKRFSQTTLAKRILYDE
ncbi:MAG: glycosyltransferase family 39 protein [bacterium]|nr:glycosyltransferase family 39 protein [bacterium]